MFGFAIAVVVSSVVCRLCCVVFVLVFCLFVLFCLFVVCFFSSVVCRLGCVVMVTTDIVSHSLVEKRSWRYFASVDVAREAARVSVH